MVSFSLTQPAWLLLLIPAALLLWQWRFGSRTGLVLRAAILLLLVTALAGPTLYRPVRAAYVVLLMDRSASMPANTTAVQAELTRLVRAGAGPHDRLSGISFGRDVLRETIDVRSGTPGGAIIREDASNYRQAIDRALAEIPHGTPGRILLIGDGHWTGSPPWDAARRAAERGIAIDHRHLDRSRLDDLALIELQRPDEVQPGESFLIHAWLQSPRGQTIDYRLLRNDQPIAEGRRQVPAGLSRLTFRDTAPRSGQVGYRVEIHGELADGIIENNTGRTLVRVSAPQPLLLLTSQPNGGLATMLQQAGLEVQAMVPSRLPATAGTAPGVPLTLDFLAGYSGIILENVPAHSFADAELAAIASRVRDHGAGLWMTGGRRSFGAGGYHLSPLEEVLPVSLELRHEHRKLRMAIVVVMDRSGSMGMPVMGGKTKMDLANIATAEVLNMLSGDDEFGVLAVDTAPHVMVPFGRVTNKARTRDQILRIGSMGGGIYVYTGLTAAMNMITQSNAGTRHIILFTDADDTEEPGNYRQLLAAATQAGITVTVIALGRPTDSDAELCRDIARRGGGRIFFTEDARELPRLFVEDTVIIARSSFITDPTPAQTTADMITMLGRAYEPDQPFGGYNISHLRPRASQAMVSVDEFASPLVAAWPVGLGRAAVFAGEVAGEFTPPLHQWPDFSRLLLSLARWTAATSDQLPENARLVRTSMRGHDRLTLHLDPERRQDPFASLPEVSVTHATAQGTLVHAQQTMTWTGPDTLETEIDLGDSDAVLATVQVGDVLRQLPPSVALYSPEFAPVSVTGGRESLRRISEISGGMLRQVPGDIWNDLDRRPRRTPLLLPLLITAMVLFLLDILERRTQWVSDLAMAAGRGLARRRQTPVSVGLEGRTDGPESLPKAAAKPSAPTPARRPAFWSRSKEKSRPQTTVSPSPDLGDPPADTGRKPAAAVAPKEQIPPGTISGVAGAMRSVRARSGRAGEQNQSK